MTKEQIAKLSSSYMSEAKRPDGNKSTLAEYVRFMSDCNIEITTSKDMVITDDTNQMVHGICVNEDMVGQSTYPVKIISLPYDHVTCIECVMSRENFKKFLDSGAVLSISAAKKDFMINWVDNLAIQGQHIDKATPYYERDAKVIQRAATSTARDDGLVSPIKEGSLVQVSQEQKDAQQELLKKKNNPTGSGGDDSGSGESGSNPDSGNSGESGSDNG